MNSIKTKSIILFALLLLLAGFKSKNGTGADFRIKKVASFIHEQDSSVFTYTPDGKIASHRGYLPVMKRSFDYSKGRVTEQGSNGVNGTLYKNIFYLNSKAIADSMMRTADNKTLCIYFKYDKSGCCVEEYSGCDKRTIETKRVFEKGNMVKQLFFSNGEQYETGYFEYYTKIPNVPTMFGTEKMGHIYRGKDSKNLLKKIVLVESKGDTVLVNNFRYHFDDKGRVVTSAVYGKEGNLADSTAYSY